MKIFLSFLQSPHQYPIAAYSFWEYYLKNGIEEAGYEWIECKEVDWAKGLVPQSQEELNNWKTNTWEKTVNYLKQHPADIFLSYLYPHQVEENAIAEIKKMGIRCINFFCDNVRNFKKVPVQFSIFDLNWVPEFKAQKMYKEAGYPFINVPMPMWVEQKYRGVPANEQDRLSFIGSKDILRQLFFEELLQKHPHFSIDIYGSAWIGTEQLDQRPPLSIRQKAYNQIRFLAIHGISPYLNKLKYGRYNLPSSGNLKNSLKGKLNFEDYIGISRESKVTIGINRYPSFNFPLHSPDTYSRLRDIEAPMLGACYLTEYTEGLENLYDLENEILAYKDVDDFVEKCQQLNQDSQLRLKMRACGQKRALAEHSIANTLTKINS